MIRHQDSYREAQYRPQAAKTLRQTLIRFIQREFARLGGPWVIELFVDKLLELVDTYRIVRERLKPGQTVWQAVAVDERPGLSQTDDRDAAGAGGDHHRRSGRDRGPTQSGQTT